MIQEPRSVVLPSGAILKIMPASFAASKGLYQALLAELQTVQILSSVEIPSIIKDVFCIGFSSPTIERCLWECIKRCTYNDAKITQETFEPVEARADYTKVCSEVTLDNVSPFLKSLFADFKAAQAMIDGILSLKSTKPAANC